MFLCLEIVVPKRKNYCVFILRLIISFLLFTSFSLSIFSKITVPFSKGDAKIHTFYYCANFFLKIFNFLLHSPFSPPPGKRLESVQGGPKSGPPYTIYPCFRAGRSSRWTARHVLPPSLLPLSKFPRCAWCSSGWSIRRILGRFCSWYSNLWSIRRTTTLPERRGSPRSGRLPAVIPLPPDSAGMRERIFFVFLCII